VATASARPQRLVDFAETTGAIADAVVTRAGWIEDDDAAYRQGNGHQWRVDVSELPGALRAWAQTLRAIGEFVGAVGTAFLDADDSDGDEPHHLGEHRLRELLPDEFRDLLDGSTATRDDEVDWGDPDDPPAWLDDLAFSAMVVAHVGDGVTTLDTAYVVGSGAGAAWAPSTPAALGRFATPASLARFSNLFSAGAAGLSGTTAALQQWYTDAASLNYTDGELAQRATTRGVITGGGALIGSFGGAWLAGALCGPGAPLCAGGVVIGTSLIGAGASDWVTGIVVGSPGPAEHDPGIVRDRVESVAPGTLLRDIPDWTLNEVIGPLEDAGEDAGREGYESRHPYLDPDALLGDLTMADTYDLPDSWVVDHLPALMPERHKVLAAAVLGVDGLPEPPPGDVDELVDLVNSPDDP
jgi:hypothetical protein